MPFKSNAQRKYLFAKLPEVAKEFAAHTPKGKKLPEHVKHMAAGTMGDCSLYNTRFGNMPKAGQGGMGTLKKMHKSF